MAAKKIKTEEVKEEVKEPQKPPETVYEVPSIDKNAALKIDEAKVETEESIMEKSGKKLYALGKIALALIVLGVLGFIVLYIQNPSEKKNTVAPVAKEAAQASPSAALLVLVRSEWTFEVLNGSGTAGVAKKAADKLEALGYKVVNTGNADAADYTGNKLYVAENMSSKAELLMADLKADFNITAVAGTLENSAVTARIIVGKSE